MPRSYEMKQLSEVYETKLTDPVGTYYVVVCSECGMPVGKSYAAAHDEWHEKLIEQIRMANVGFGGFGL